MQCNWLGIWTILQRLCNSRYCQRQNPRSFLIFAPQWIKVWQYQVSYNFHSFCMLLIVFTFNIFSIFYFYQIFRGSSCSLCTNQTDMLAFCQSILLEKVRCGQNTKYLVSFVSKSFQYWFLCFEVLHKYFSQIPPTPHNVCRVVRYHVLKHVFYYSIEGSSAWFDLGGEGE